MRGRLFAALFASCLFCAVSAVHVELDERNLVMFPPCGKKLCPPMPLQKPIGPPPKAYKCDCTDPGVHSDCRCPRNPTMVQNPYCAPGKDCRIKGTSTTRVVGLFNPDRRPVVLRRKFLPPTTAPNPLPPLQDSQCRPNVFNVGPGNCYRVPDTGKYCDDPEAQCANDDNGSKGFIAASLSTSASMADSLPANEVQQCQSSDGSSSSSGSSSSMSADSMSMSGSSSGTGPNADGAAFSSAPNEHGERVEAVVQAKDACGRPIKFTKDDVFIAPPKRIGGSPSASGSMSMGSGSMTDFGSESGSLSASSPLASGTSMGSMGSMGSEMSSGTTAGTGAISSQSTMSDGIMGPASAESSALTSPTSSGTPSASGMPAAMSSSMPMVSVSQSGPAPAQSEIPAAELTSAPAPAKPKAAPQPASTVTPVKL